VSNYTNTIRRMDTGEPVREFTCTCPPDSRSHDRMVMGALRNTDMEKFWLDDGKPSEQSEVSDPSQ
jgi:hypothetical protein